jgi:hypothetical protein
MDCDDPTHKKAASANALAALVIACSQPENPAALKAD